MNIIADTQALIWFSEGNPALKQNARQAMTDPNNTCFVSMASFWEMSIKISIGKLDVKGLSLEEFMEEMEQNNFITLEINKKHVLLNGKLPLIHKDPFDRLIAAQVLFEDWQLVSSDDIFDQYGVARIW